MSVNKVQLANGETIIDISDSTVTPETLVEGVTAHDASGQKITGKMAPGGGTSVQTDWNQTDETAPDFLKNKPFGEEKIEIVPEQSFFPDPQGALLDYAIAPEVDTEVKITFDGESYTYTVIDFFGMGIAAGNDAVMGGEGTGGVPCLVVWANGVCFVMTLDETVSHTVAVVGEKIKKLPAKYSEQAAMFYTKGDNNSDFYLYKEPKFQNRVAKSELYEAVTSKVILINVRSADDNLTAYGTGPAFFVEYMNEWATVYIHNAEGTAVQYYTAEHPEA